MTRFAPAGAAQLLDTQREVPDVAPSWRGWLHLVWFNASLVGGTLLLVAAHGSLRVSAAAIYAASVTGLFGVSALYHLGTWRPAAQAVLARLDHLMVFVLIAATATSVFLTAPPRAYGRVCLVAIWILTAAAAVLGFWTRAPSRLAGGVFIGIAVTAALALPSVWASSGNTVGPLIVCGAMLYCVGAVVYLRRRPDPAPPRFGFHEVFDAVVCAAATCHYAAIALLVL